MVLLHAFIKKTQAISSADLQIALRRQQEFFT
jgi:phage-related protein